MDILAPAVTQSRGRLQPGPGRDVLHGARQMVRRRPLTAYIVIAYGLSWGYWLPLVLRGQVVTVGGSVTQFPGLLGPLVAAFCVTAAVDGRDGVRDLLRRVLRWRVGIRWWLVALGSPLVLAAVAVAIVSLRSGSTSYADFGRMGGLPQWGVAFVWVVFVVVNGLGEETGWRGFVHAGLRRDHGWLTTSLLVTPIWAGWHLPLFLLLQNYRDLGPIGVPGFVIGLTCGSLVLGWLYEWSGYSILIAAVWHGTYNLTAATAAAHGLVAAVVSTGVTVAAVVLAVALRRRPATCSPNGGGSTGPLGPDMAVGAGFTARIQRASATDLMERASDVGPLPMQVGAILRFAPGSTLTASAVRAALVERVVGVPRLRQRLEPTPFGCGRPVWIDDPEFDVARHVHHLVSPAPGDEAALLRVAAEVIASPLHADQPLWSATLVSGLRADGCALVVVLHHVLADGMGGLTILAHLLDGAALEPARPFPVPRPRWHQLAADAAVSRLRSLRQLRRGPARVRAALAEIRPGAVPRAPRCSLNRPVRPLLRRGIVRADLAQVRSIAHSSAGTVNDVLLAVVGGALDALLAHRGEHVDHVVVSVPISSRTALTAEQSGNQVGAFPVVVPSAGSLDERLRAISQATRGRTSGSRGASDVLLAPAYRVLGALGVLRWLVERQRFITTLVSNLAGPRARVSLLGQGVVEVIPLTVLTGNVTVGFVALSYAGSLTVTVTADEHACPDVDVLVDALQAEFDALLARG